MTRVLIVALTILWIGISNASAADVTQQTTVAGHKYWHFPIEGSKRTAVALRWSSGLTALPEGQEMAPRIGISMMLNAGADGKSPDEIVADFNDLDAGSQLSVQPTEIRGYIVTPDSAALEAAAIANIVLTKPNLNEKWLARERKKLADKGRGRDGVIWGIAWTLVRHVMFDGHPFERFWSLQPVENIDAVSLDTIKEWHKSAFKTDGLQITVAGSSDFETIGKAIDIAIDGLPGGKAPPRIEFSGPTISAKTILFHAPRADKSLILVLGKIAAGSKGKDLEINLATGVLGFGGQSRLFKAVRTGLRASYGFGSGLTTFTRDHRVLRLSGEVETKLLQKALDTVEETYEEFRADGVGIIEFPFARSIYSGRVDDALKKPDRSAYLLMESRLNGMPDNDLPTMVDRIGNLARGDVNKFIKDRFPPFENMLKIIVSPDANAIEGACVITDYEQAAKCLQ